MAFTGWSNEGFNTLANSLSGIGQAFGNSFIKQQERQMLSDIGTKIQSGDLRGAADMAFKSGDTSTGVNLLKLVDAQDQRTAQQQADASVFNSINGVPNSTPSNAPMNLAGTQPANNEVASYIVQAAKARGIDPSVALQVWKSEGKGGYVGDNGSSFGPLQLHYGGVAKGGNSVAGLGDEFTKKTGLDARDPTTWKQQIDFSLDTASKTGWTPWHGWKGDPMAGIGGKPVQVADASGNIPQSANIDALMSRRNNIMKAMSSQAISDNARQQLNTMLQDTTFQIERADRMSQQPGMKLQQEAEQRLAIGQKQGLTGDALQSYALTGKLPKEDQQLTAGDREAIRTADENIQASNNVINALTQAKTLSKQALGFPGAGVAAKAGALFGNDTAIATTELDNLISGQALDSLRAVFGGNPTEGERKILLDIQGSSSQPDAIRQKIFDRAITAAQKRQQFNQDRANELRGGTYYKPKDQANPQATGDVKTAKPIPSDILDEARAAIPRKGRDAVINMLRQQGFDTNGL